MRTVHELRLGSKLRSLVDRKMVKYLCRRAASRAQLRGSRMAIFANEHIGIQINQYGVYELAELTLLFDFLAPLESEFRDATVIDAGANIGNHSLFFAPRFARVLAFEPNPATFHLLQFNAEPAGNIQVLNQGLGEAPGTLMLVEDAVNMGASSVARTAGQLDRQIPIDIVTLDQAAANVERIALIKIDVEGFEISVLKGATSIIDSHRPLIVFEQHAAEFTDGSTDCLRFLADAGYRFCWHQKGSALKSRALARLVDWREYVTGTQHRIVHDETVPARNHSMLIAVPPRYSQRLMA